MTIFSVNDYRYASITHPIHVFNFISSVDICAYPLSAPGKTKAEKALEKAVAKAKAELQLANVAKRKLAEELASTKSGLKDMEGKESHVGPM